MGGGVGARVGSVRWGEGGMLSLWNIDRNTVLFLSVSPRLGPSGVCRTPQDFDQTMALDATSRSMNASALRDWEVRTGTAHFKRMGREADRIAELDEQHEEARERVVW